MVSLTSRLAAIVQNAAVVLVGLGLMSGAAQADPVPKFVLAVNYADDNVSVFRVQPLTGQLAQVPHSPFAIPGDVPWGITVSPNGKFVYVGTFDSAKAICVFSLNERTGSLTPVESYHVPGKYGAYAVTITPDGRFLYATITQGIMGYRVDERTGALKLIDGSPWDVADQYFGIAIDPRSQYAYGIVWNPNYAPWIQAAQILPDGRLSFEGGPVYAGSPPNDVKVDPSGRFVYVANWGDSTISGYSIDAGLGTLTGLPGSPYSGVSVPTSLSPTPDGKAVIVDNQGGDFVDSLAINSDGSLTPVGSSQPAEQYPNAVVVDPTNEFAYSANTNSNTVSAYRVDAMTGALQPVAGGFYISGWDPNRIAVVAGPRPPYCPLNTIDPSVTLCAPQTSTPSPMRVVAGTTDFTSPIQTMEILIDGVTTFEQTGGGSMDVYVRAPSGNHTLRVAASDTGGHKFRMDRQITISGSTDSVCTDRGITPAVTICTPLGGAHTGNSVHVVAKSVGILPVSSTAVYVDGQEVYSVAGGSINTYLDVRNGTHWIKVRSTDDTGSIWSSSVHATVH
jgi:6-phosphogluconolactonase